MNDLSANERAAVIEKLRAAISELLLAIEEEERGGVPSGLWTTVELLQEVIAMLEKQAL
jgi:hypothetical protein